MSSTDQLEMWCREMRSKIFRGFASRRLASTLGLGFITLVVGCTTSPGGTNPRCFAFNVTPAGGGTPQVLRVVAPVLPGSVVEKSTTVSGDIIVTVKATNQDVTVDVAGATSFTTDYTYEELDGGALGADTPLEAQGRSSDLYEISVSGC